MPLGQCNTKAMQQSSCVVRHYGVDGAVASLKFSRAAAVVRLSKYEKGSPILFLFLNCPRKALPLAGACCSSSGRYVGRRRLRLGNAEGDWLKVTETPPVLRGSLMVLRTVSVCCEFGAMRRSLCICFPASIVLIVLRERNSLCVTVE